jgi:hypothetical protein
MLFHIIEDKQTVVRNCKTGVYKQANLYRRKGEIYARIGGGFIRLLREGRTSQPALLWDDIEVQYEVVDGISGALRMRSSRKAVA